MISHKYKCIFIHIPRTGGTFIEKFIFGKDWWGEDKNTKHIIASQAKKIYKRYWDNYFKFSFVRNPYNRSISMLYHSEEYYGQKDLNRISLDNLNFYKKKFNFPKIVESDQRFYNLQELANDSHKSNQVYLNILDEKLDFIGKYENFDNDLKIVSNKIGIKFFLIKKLFTKKVSQSKELKNHKNINKTLIDQKVKDEIYNIYKNDFLTFGYKRK